MHWDPNENAPMTIIHCKTLRKVLTKNEKQEKSERKFSSISGCPQRNGHLKSVPGAGEEDETIYIRSSMEEEEDKALLETRA